MRRNRPALFKGRHFEAEIIVLCVRWYVRYPLSLRQVEEIMAERNLSNRSRHNLALGPAVRAGTEPTLPTGAPEHEPVVASRRDVLPGRWQVDVFISGCGFDQCHDRLSPERQARRGCGQTLSAEGIAFAGAPPAEGHQRGWKPVVPQGHNRTQAKWGTRQTVPMQARTLLEQYRGAGPPSHQTACPSESGIPSNFTLHGERFRESRR